MLLSCLAIENINQIEILEQQDRPKKRKCWVRQFYDRRGAELKYNELISTFNIEGPEFYRQFTRISENGFKFLVDKIRYRIEKQDTFMRMSITAALKYLATGDLFFILSSLFHVSKSSICHIVPEVCEALYYIER